MAHEKRILIADDDARAGKQLKAALQRRGYAVSLAHSGPHALELAIDKRPDLCVLATNLALIDGHRLAEIIRVNPHTQHALFIFLTPDPLPPRPSTGFREEVLRKPYAVEELVAHIDRLFQRSERLAEVSRETGSGIQGDLSQVPLSDLLQMFSLNRRTGTLMLTEPGATRGIGQGFIYLKDGETINALLGHIEGEKALFRLLDWPAGHFEFIPDQAVTELRIRTPIHTLLIESARQSDEWDKLRAELPAPGTELRLRARVASLPPGVHPLTQEVLLLLEFHSRLEEIVDNCSAPDYQVLRTLHTLLRKGIVEAVSRAADAPSADRAAAAWPTPDQMIRLREKMAPRGMPPWGRTFGKVLVFARDAAVAETLVSALWGLAGITTGNMAPENGAGERDPFPTLATWQLSATVSLRLVQVPSNDLHRPLWPLLARGAIGGLICVEGNSGPAIDSLKPVHEFFHTTQPLPLGYLLIAPEEEQAAAKSRLVRTFTLKGDSAIFMLPKDGRAKIPAALKRFLDLIIAR